MRLAGGSHRFQPLAAEHSALVARFLDAAQGGDLGGLRTLLAENVIAWNDGGGRVQAAPRPVEGRDRVLRFVTGLLGKYALSDVRLLEVNGGPAAWLTMGGQEQLEVFDIGAGLIRGIYGVLNPGKSASCASCRADPSLHEWGRSLHAAEIGVHARMA